MADDDVGLRRIGLALAGITMLVGVMAVFVVTTSVNLAGFWPHSELVAAPAAERYSRDRFSAPQKLLDVRD